MGFNGKIFPGRRNSIYKTEGSHVGCRKNADGFSDDIDLNRNSKHIPRRLLEWSGGPVCGAAGFFN